MKEWNLNNKTALITGGSKGIGKATAWEFLSLGAKVLCMSRNKEELADVQKEFEKMGYSIGILAGDVSDDAARNDLYDHIMKHGGKLDVLVNNAGINVRKPSIEYTQEELMKVINIDLIAPFELSRKLFDPLRKASGASVINIGSIAGSFDLQTGAPYGMAKSGLIQMSRNLAQEWAVFNIRVNTVSPGFTETPLTKTMLAQHEKKERILARTPLKRIGADEEIAAVVGFLAMDKSSYVTGQNFVADGGITSGLL